MYSHTLSPFLVLSITLFFLQSHRNDCAPHTTALGMSHTGYWMLTDLNLALNSSVFWYFSVLLIGLHKALDTFFWIVHQSTNMSFKPDSLFPAYTSKDTTQSHKLIFYHTKGLSNWAIKHEFVAKILIHFKVHWLLQLTSVLKYFRSFHRAGKHLHWQPRLNDSY